MISIYICAHNKIQNELPKGNGYLIAAQNENVSNTELPVTLMNDSFTKDHKIGYGECCQIHYLYEHQDLISKYIGITHYRRFFKEFIDDTSLVPELIEKYGAIYSKKWSSGLQNYVIMQLQHCFEWYDILNSILTKSYPQYEDIIKSFWNDKECCYCNMFIMKKEDFLAGCKFVFDVLQKYDDALGIKNDGDIHKYISSLQTKKHWSEENSKWQERMEGFLSEYLWDIFRRIRFGECYYSPLCLIGEQDKTYQLKN